MKPPEDRPVWDWIADDALMIATGRVVYEGARLEQVASNLWYRFAHMTGDDEIEKSRGKALAPETKRVPVDALLRTLARAIPLQNDPGTIAVMEEAKSWAEEAKPLLEGRNGVVHSILADYPGGPLMAVHVSASGTAASFIALDDDGPAKLLLLAAEIFAHRCLGE
jgi:hypothetical protein